MADSSNQASDNKDELRQKLVDCMESEDARLKTIAEKFFKESKRTDQDKDNLLAEVIKSANEILAVGGWQDSRFLFNVVKPLIAIRNAAEKELLDRQSQKVKGADIAPLADDEEKVYISLFQSDGMDMSKWGIQLRSLERYIVGRPIYQDEAHVQQRIRLRVKNHASEAYVIFAVRKKDVITNPYQSQGLKDTHGNPLIQLSEVAVDHGRILGFVHQKTLYHLVDGRLKQVGPVA